MADPIQLPLEERLSMELQLRSIDKCDDIGFLRSMCKSLLHSWYGERMRTLKLIQEGHRESSR